MSRVNNKSLSVTSTTVLYICLMLPFYKPGYIAEMQIGFVELAYASLEVAVTIWAIFKLIRNKIKLTSPFVGGILALAAFVLIATLVGFQSPRNWLGQWAPRVVVVILVMIASRENLNCIISASIILTAVLCSINLITVVAYPDGLYQTSSTFAGDNYFLGHRNGTSGIIIQMIFSSMLMDNIDEEDFTISIRTIVLYVIGFIQSVVAFSATTVIALLVVCIGCFILHSKKLEKVICPIEACLVAVIGNLGIVVFRVQELVAPLIELLLHRDATLSSRTIIWDKTFELISWPHTILGRGIDGHNQIVINETTIASAHNECLNILLQSGIIGFAAYLVVLGSVIVAAIKTSSTVLSRVASLLLTTIFIIGITYVTSSTAVYLMLALLYFTLIKQMESHEA